MDIIPSNKLDIQDDMFDLMLDKELGANSLSRIRRFQIWVYENDITFPNFSIRDYINDMRDNDYADSSIESHLSTIRTALRRLKIERDFWFYVFDGNKSLVDEVVVRLENQCEVTFKSSKSQDDVYGVRLTRAQQDKLLGDIRMLWLKRRKLPFLRDLAMVSLQLATGLRAEEICSLLIKDLEVEYEGLVGLFVRRGKGDKSRFVPYGGEESVLVIVHEWIDKAEITEGLVFPSIGRDSRTVLRGESMRGDSYARRIKKWYDIEPHDLRRTYARIHYEEGMGMEEIRQNLGHADVKTTQRYIGQLDMARRAPKTGYDFGSLAKNLG